MFGWGEIGGEEMLGVKLYHVKGFESLDLKIFLHIANLNFVHPDDRSN